MDDHAIYLTNYKGSQENLFRVQHFINIVLAKIEEADFSSIIQDEVYFTEAIDHCLSNMEGEGITRKYLKELLVKVANQNGVYISEKINGRWEYALASEAYTEEGKQITHHPLEHFMNEDIYFNTDESFFNHQQNQLVEKHALAHMNKENIE